MNLGDGCKFHISHQKRSRVFVLIPMTQEGCEKAFEEQGKSILCLQRIRALRWTGIGLSLQQNRQTAYAEWRK